MTYRIMAFDVETTGLLPKFDRTTGKVPPITEYPTILQLSYLIYDMDKRAIMETYNTFVKVADEIEITPFITGLTGIDRMMCDKQGKEIDQVLRDFCAAYMSADCVIAHNLFGFDKKMVEIEIHRNISKVSGVPNMCFLFNETFNNLRGKTLVCTMELSKQVCHEMYKDANEKMCRKNKDGSIWRKPPKLVELHEFLFGSKPDGLHDAKVDTYVCMKCYLKIMYGITI
jgi:DNA polymerase III epsilon subunit-like protein